MRILVCGGREWTNKETILRELSPLKGKSVSIIHGGCRGADVLAGEVSLELGFDTIEIKAEWKKYGRAAGILRNIKMFDDHQPDIVLAFHEDIENSRGTKHMIDYAKRNKCPVRLITQ